MKGICKNTTGILIKRSMFFTALLFPEGILCRQLTRVIESQAAINKWIPNEVAELCGKHIMGAEPVLTPNVEQSVFYRNTTGFFFLFKV